MPLRDSVSLGLNGVVPVKGMVIRLDKKQEMVPQELKDWLEETKDVKLEEMSEFFGARVEEYEEHMAPWKEYYSWMAKELPENAKEILDIGCGTGLELDAVFGRFPKMQVTAIDLSEGMLRQLKEKHKDRKLHLICEDYFTANFGEECYDAAISFETLHHFTADKKREVFQKLYKSIKPGGCYIECDYIAGSIEEEELLLSECKRRRKRDGIPDNTFVHFDIPLTLEHEIKTMEEAGFEKVEVLGYLGENRTPMIRAWKIEGTVTILNISQMTGLTDRTIRNYIKRGLLQGNLIKGVWRFSKASLEAFFDEKFVKQGLEGKAAILVEHFLSDWKEIDDSLCSVYKLKINNDNSQKLCDELLEKINANNYRGMQFYYNFNKKTKIAKFVVTGLPEDVIDITKLLNTFRKQKLTQNSI